MFSFQPAAYLGNDNRWSKGFRTITDDAVWAEVEAGVGRSLPYRVLQFGDLRCNRTSWGAFVGDRFVPVFEENEPADLATRDAYLKHLRGNYMSEPRLAIKVLRVSRLLLSHPSRIGLAARWVGRFVRRAGGARRLRHGVVPVTFVMHSFIDASAVGPAWELLQRNEQATDPVVLAAQERLLACTYAMGHPKTGQIVPACLQHGVLDPGENQQLAVALPLPSRRR